MRQAGLSAARAIGQMIPPRRTSEPRPATHPGTSHATPRPAPAPASPGSSLLARAGSTTLDAVDNAAVNMGYSYDPLADQRVWGKRPLPLLREAAAEAHLRIPHGEKNGWIPFFRQPLLNCGWTGNGCDSASAHREWLIPPLCPCPFASRVKAHHPFPLHHGRHLPMP